MKLQMCLVTLCNWSSAQQGRESDESILHRQPVHVVINRSIESAALAAMVFLLYVHTPHTHTHHIHIQLNLYQ